MTDPFELVEDDMSGTSQQASPAGTGNSAAEPVRATVVPRHICPFCGHPRPASADACPHCTMEDTPATRQSTKARIGPWYVLQARNPSAPGMKFATVLALLTRGQITPRSVMRGPTTHQLWRIAAHVRGVSREFGLCYSCGGSIDRAASTCARCQRSQEPPPDPDILLENRAATAAEETSHAARLNAWEKKRALNAHAAPMLQAPAGPARPRSAVARSNGSRVVSAVGLAEALKDQSGAAGRERGRPLLKAFAILLLLAAVAGGGLLWARPDLRARTLEWTNRQWALVQDQFNQITLHRSIPQPTSRPPSEPAAPPEPHEPADLNIVAAPTPETAAPQPPAENSSEPKPAAGKAGADAAKQQATADAGSGDVSPLERERHLWPEALAAEGRGDDSVAVQIYQEIKGLPHDVWPAGLQLRLDMAQQRVEKSASAAK